jgi:hypothetical protein
MLLLLSSEQQSRSSIGMFTEVTLMSRGWRLMLMAIKLLRAHLRTRAMLRMLLLLRIQQHLIQLRQIHLAHLIKQHLIAQVRRTVRQAVPIPRTKLPQAMRRQRVTQPRLPIRPRTALAPTQHPQIRLPHPRIHRRLPATPAAPIQLIAPRQTPQIPLMLLVQPAAAEEDSSPLLLASISTFMKLRFSN